MNSPCQWCTERTLTCHGFCSKYKDFRKKLDNMAAKKRKPEDTPEFSRKKLRYIWRDMKWK